MSDSTDQRDRLIASSVNADGKTADGNDPQTEFYYENELDPARVLPATQYQYLDRVQREEAEKARAVVEGRKPDLDNPPPMSGTPLRTHAQLDNPSNVNVALALAKAKPALVEKDVANLRKVKDDNDGDSNDNSAGAGDSGSGSVSSSTVKK